MQHSGNVVSYKVLSLTVIIWIKLENFSGSYDIAIHGAFEVLNQKYKLSLLSITFCYLSYLLDNLKNGKPEITISNSLNDLFIDQALPSYCLQGL